MIHRRNFLRFLVRAGASLPLLQQAFIQRAFASDPLVSMADIQSTAHNNVLILLRLFGGNDGLNTLVPFEDALYYKYRSEDAAYKQAIMPDEVLRLSGVDSLGFHPGWAKLRTIFDEGKMTIVQNVGYPEQDLSHFRSTDIWLSASDADVFDNSGWIGRYFEARNPEYPQLIPTAPFCIEFATSLTRLSLGQKNHIGFGYTGVCPINKLSDIKNSRFKDSFAEQQYIAETMNLSGSFLHTLNEAESAVPKNAVEYPAYNNIAGKLATAARLIASGLPTRVYALTSDLMFDTHGHHLEHHGEALRFVAEAVYAFQRDIEALGVADRVVIMLYSEFGRRVATNGSGTDHGAAAPVFLIGNKVSGTIIGSNPDLENLDANGNLRFETDYRQVYASLLEQWFGERVAGLHPLILPHAVQTLPIFKAPSQSDGLQSCYPNPCTTATTITLRNENIRSIVAINSIGQAIKLPYSRDGVERISVDVRGLAAGAYYLFIQDGEYTRRASFVKL